jgi:hypothetical protein
VSVVELPSLKRARARRIPSGVEIIAPEKTVRLRIPRDASPLEFLKAIYQNKRLPLDVRMEAARDCLPYCHPKLIMVAASNVDQATLKIAITGGLPPLPGTSVIIPLGTTPSELPMIDGSHPNPSIAAASSESSVDEAPIGA